MRLIPLVSDEVAEESCGCGGHHHEKEAGGCGCGGNCSGHDETGAEGD